MRSFFVVFDFDFGIAIGKGNFSQRTDLTPAKSNVTELKFKKRKNTTPNPSLYQNTYNKDKNCYHTVARQNGISLSHSVN